jgi:hypothetical protein
LDATLTGAAEASGEVSASELSLQQVWELLLVSHWLLLLP